jgi:hypothetical protein
VISDVPPVGSVWGWIGSWGRDERPFDIQMTADEWSSVLDVHRWIGGSKIARPDGQMTLHG